MTTFLTLLHRPVAGSALVRATAFLIAGSALTGCEALDPCSSYEMPALRIRLQEEGSLLPIAGGASITVTANGRAESHAFPSDAQQDTASYLTRSQDPGQYVIEVTKPGYAAGRADVRVSQSSCGRAKQQNVVVYLRRLPSASVTVERVSGDQQGSLGGEELAEPLVARFADGGRPLAGTLVTFVASAGIVTGAGFVSGGSITVRTDSAGLARAWWRVPPDTSGLGRQGVVVRLATGALDSVVFRARGLAPSEADLVLTNAQKPVTLLLYATGAFSSTEYIRRDFRDSSHLSRHTRTRLSEVAAFTPGSPPLVAVRRPPGAPGRDTVYLGFAAEPVRIPLTVWVVQAPFDSTVKLVQRHLAAIGTTWEAQGGLGLRDVRIVDQTQAPALAHLRDKLASSCDPGTWARVGSDSGRLNAYYVGQPAVGSGAHCGGGRMEIYPLAWNRSPATLAHEIGHTLLGNHHETVPNNVMHFQGDGNTFTLGQIFRAHFSSWSALNTLFRVYPASMQRECAVSPTSSVPVCPPTGYVF